MMGCVAAEELPYCRINPVWPAGRAGTGVAAHGLPLTVSVELEKTGGLCIPSVFQHYQYVPKNKLY